MLKLLLQWIEDVTAERTDAPNDWHRCHGIQAHQLVNGSWAEPHGQLWRQMTASGWQYRQDEESEEAWLSRVGSP